jgi:hypothetical protein
MSDYFNPQQRQREKEFARERDERDLRDGAVSRQDLSARNGFFSSLQIVGSSSGTKASSAERRAPQARNRTASRLHPPAGGWCLRHRRASAEPVGRAIFGCPRVSQLRPVHLQRHGLFRAPRSGAEARRCARRPRPNAGTQRRDTQSAIVEAEIQGETIEIDFLSHVLGVNADVLQRSAVELILKVRTAAGDGTLAVPIMHPLHVLQSRVANVLELKRTTDLATRQLNASPIVLREYVGHMLDLGSNREATATLEQLFEYLRSHLNGRRAHKVMANDPATILDHFAQDVRIDDRYRALTLDNMREQLRQRRSAWARMAAMVGVGRR